MNNSSSASIPNETKVLRDHNSVTTELKIGMTVAYAVNFVFALLGNSFGLSVVLKKSSPLGRIMSLFIANMAAADLLLTCTVVPYQVAYFHSGGTWFGGAFGTVTCKLFSYVVTVSIAATVLTMLVISIDRFHVIFYPLKRRLFRKPKILSTIIWFLSFLLMIPCLLYSAVEFDTAQSAYTCSQLSSKLDKDVIKIFHVCLFITLYALPLFFMVLLHLLICRKLWLRKIPGNVSCESQTAVGRSKRKIVRLLVIIVVVFAFCWFPTYVNHYFWFIRRESKLPMGVQFFFLWLAHANSAINPCLYIMFNDHLRSRLISTLKSYF
ncbi:probable G-protein coupled receptor 83 [Stylophora pistillata]|uniref:probable G-protein coupled receptor 83 n=1 Tax=Stylophora pistillata TaxID=50429 RepID=UPI000C057699|nr:probable G-protein coupled receptor 83 [Stylophora pistillata]